MNDKPIRLHPIVIVKSAVSFIFILVFTFFFMRNTGAPLLGIVAIYSVIIFLVLVVLYLRWYKTTVTFGDDEICINRDTIFKLNKRIHYSKLASVNKNRDILDRIFGTTVLLLNINSAANPTIPEIQLIFKSDVSDKIYEDLNNKVFRQNTQSVQDIIPEMESWTNVSAGDVFLHSLLSQSTATAIYGWIFLGIAIVQFMIPIFSGSAKVDAILYTLIPFIFLNIVPAIFSFLKYMNFKISRDKDMIYISKGLIYNYKTSFNVSKINAIRVRNTLISRLLNKSWIEVEVVGVNTGGNETSPVLCIMKDNTTILENLSRLVPEFTFSDKLMSQPKESKIPILLSAVLMFIFAVSIVSTTAIYFISELPSTEYSQYAAYVEVIAFAIIIIILLVVAYWAYAAYTVPRFGIGENSIRIKNGTFDRSDTILKYGKIQVVSIKSGLIARKYNLSKAGSWVLSYVGYSIIKTGYFRTEVLEEIPKTILDRINQ